MNIGECYAFDLHLRCGGYAYFSTITQYVRHDDRYERRVPSLVSHSLFGTALEKLGHPARLIRNSDEFEYWLSRRGCWGLVPIALARDLMPQWLKAKRCLCSALGTFTDVEISA